LDSTGGSQSNDLESHGRSANSDGGSDDAASESGAKITMIKKQRSSEKLNLMLTACSRGDIHRVKAVIKCGEVDINSTDSMDRTGAWISFLFDGACPMCVEACVAACVAACIVE